MPQGNPKPGEFYRHFKKKNYQVITVARHSEIDEQLVIYQALYGDFGTYARPLDMFVSEVDHVKYPEVEQKYRFEYLEEGLTQDIMQQVAVGEMKIKDEQADTDAIPEVSEVSEAADPALIRFMDAGSFSEKFEVFTELRKEMTDKLLDEIAVVCDLVISEEGSLDERYEHLKRCLLTRMKYERERDY